jgi:hypothetical protein
MCTSNYAKECTAYHKPASSLVRDSPSISPPLAITKENQTPGLWRHKTRPVTFSLVVDDFGVKYVGRRHAEHLVAALEALYPVTTDWHGQLYCELTLHWDYAARTVDLSMPGYIPAALHKFQYPPPLRPQHSPHHWHHPNYGVPTQLTPPADESKPLPPDGIQRLQQIIGTLLYYARAVDPTLLVALATLGSAQAKDTEATATATVHLLNYCATNPDACLCYKASDMVLYIHSDASYLSDPKARSRSGGHFFLSDRPADLDQPPTKAPTPNGPLHTSSVILRNVMASAAEAEVGPSLSMHKKAPSSAQPSLSSAIPNRLPRSNPVIQPPQVLPTPRFANGTPRLSIRAFIGSATASNTVTSSFTGALVPRTWPTTSPSTIQRPITA